jgi:multidrug efflux system membrane fusion protein
MDSSTPSALRTEGPAQRPPIDKRPRRSSARLWIWLTLFALMGATGFVLWPRIQQAARTNPAPAAAMSKKGRGQAIPVVAAKAKRGNIGVYITGLGAVTPIYTVTVKSRVDGQLMELHYKEGQIVHKDDALVEIDPRPFQVQLSQAEAKLLTDQAALDNARIDLARYEKLITQNAIPEQQLATQKALVTQDEGVVKADQAQIESAKLNLVYSHITAPITGLAGLRLVDPGNIVHATDNNGLVVITQLEPISVIFTVAEDQLPPVLKKMRAGQTLRVDAWDRDLKTKLAEGTLETLDNQIDQTTGTLKLRSIFENKDDSLYPNQFVNARLLVEEKYSVVLAPNAAVQRNSQATYVWLVKPDQTVTVRNVTVGTTEGDVTEITSGLAAGDVLVIDGVDKLQEGGKVSASGV